MKPQTAELAGQMAEALAFSAEPMTEEVVEAGESSMVVEEARANKVAIDIMGEYQMKKGLLLRVKSWRSQPLLESTPLRLNLMRRGSRQLLSKIWW